MKKFWIAFLLIWVLIFISKPVLAQSEYQSEFIPLTPKPVKLRPAKEFKVSVNPTIQNFITFYQGGGRATMESGLSNAGLHEKLIRRIFREEGVPENLAVLSQTLWMAGIENSNGLWLFDDKTAAKYGLIKSKYVDEKLSFEKATRAAAVYLNYLSKKYKGNWELAIAAYISGEQEVDHAVKRAGIQNFWKISKYLSRENRDFVPNVLATILITGNPPKYGFEVPQKELPVVYDSVRVPPSLSLDLTAQFSESTLEEIKRLNPELISNTTPPEAYIIRIPQGKEQIFVKKLQQYFQDKKQ